MIMNKLNELYQTMLETFKGGLSNTSTKKFDGIVGHVASLLGIPEEDVYATGSGSRPGNLEVRLSQGVRATTHTKVGLGFIVDSKNDEANVIKLTNSALTTCRKFLGRGKAHYDNIVILIESNGVLSATGLICLKKTDLTEKVISELGISKVVEISSLEPSTDRTISEEKYQNQLMALRTKPFLLLAGISGTGKSRIVRELAFKSCPEELQDEDKTTPGNYCMIEVKPNWHDSTELLGYWSNINGRYMFTKFTKFLVKAKMYPDVPFFVCLDEMNLAPVEQYFAEFLSVLETRKFVKEGNTTKIKTGALVDKQYFNEFAKLSGTDYPVCKNDRQFYQKLYGITGDKHDNAGEENESTSLLTEGLTFPDNVFIVGTVNMDDTTHQFSRKVIDRAMTIEMNGGELADIFKGRDALEYCEGTPEITMMGDLRAKYVNAIDVLEHCETINRNEQFVNFITGQSEEDSLPKRLENINKVLSGTPFTVSYRVMNELTIYLAVLLDDTAKQEDVDEQKFLELVNTAIDRILLMKILPRVEGDDEMFRLSDEENKGLENKHSVIGNYDYTKLDWLYEISPSHRPDEEEPVYMAVDKLKEMIQRLHRQNFTRYWP